MKQGYLSKLLLLSLCYFAIIGLINPCLAFGVTVPPRFELVKENESLQLFLDKSTTEIAIASKESGRIWYSNPDDDRTKGQFSIEYYTPNDGFRTMNNYKDSILHDQFEITEIQNGIKIDYLIGLSWNDQDYLPTFISEERLNEKILANITNEQDRQFVRDSYIQFSLDEVDSDFPRVTVSQVDKETLFGSLALISETNPSGRERQDFVRHVLEQYRTERNDIDSITQIRPELIEPFKYESTMVISNMLWPWDMDNLIEIIKSSGYTPEDKQFDSEFYNLDPPEQPVEIFRISVEYLLEDDSLVVRIPNEDIEYPKDAYTSQHWGMRGVHWTVVDDELLLEAFGRIEGGKVTFPLHALNLLRFFATPDPEKPGYMFIPDGSGALINLTPNRVRKTDDMILQHRLYGRDLSNIGGPADEEMEQELERYFERQLLPVFGMSQGDSGLFAIIEHGDAIASIVAETQGQVNPVDTIYPKFRLIPVGTVQLAESSRGGGGAYINTYQQRLSNTDIQVRYFFLEDDDANYSGMARLYQQYLVERYGLKKIKTKTDIPFYLELIGGIHRKQPILGVPRMVIEPITTHDQAREIVGQILDEGVENIVFRYRGWLEGGLEHIYPNKVSLERTLGDHNSFKTLAQFLAKHGIEFYPDVTYTTIAKTRFDDGFRVRSHAAYSLNKHYVTRLLPSGTESHVLSVSKLEELVNNFLNDYDNYDINGLSLSDLASNINSDYREKEQQLLDRQQAKDIISNVIREMSQKKFLLMDNANVYALPYAEHVLNVPINNSNFIATDRAIPFYQMVVHGYVNHAGKPINHVTDIKEALLKSLEVGANPYFLWGYRDSSVVKDTPFGYLLSTNYRTWLDVAVEFYNEVNSVLRTLQGQRIIEHRELMVDVYETTYEEGTKIIVNYRHSPVYVEGYLIDAQSYLVMEGGKK